MVDFIFSNLSTFSIKLPPKMTEGSVLDFSKNRQVVHSLGKQEDSRTQQ